MPLSSAMKWHHASIWSSPSLGQGPVSITKFHLYFKLDANPNPNFNNVITTKFYTCHGSYAATACAKFCNDLTVANSYHYNISFTSYLNFCQLSQVKCSLFCFIIPYITSVITNILLSTSNYRYTHKPCQICHCSFYHLLNWHMNLSV